MTMEDTQESVQCADLEAGRRTGTLEGQEWREPPVVVESKGAYDEFCLQWFLDHVHPKTNIYRQAGANRGHQKKNLQLGPVSNRGHLQKRASMVPVHHQAKEGEGRQDQGGGSNHGRTKFVEDEQFFLHDYRRRHPIPTVHAAARFEVRPQLDFSHEVHDMELGVVVRVSQVAPI